MRHSVLSKPPKLSLLMLSRASRMPSMGMAPWDYFAFCPGGGPGRLMIQGLQARKASIEKMLYTDV